MSEDLRALDLDSLLCFPLYATARAVSRTYATLLDDVGFTYPQYLVVFVLWHADGPLTIGQIGEQLHLDSGTLTPLVKRLESMGYVERRRDPSDERRVLVELTSAGEQLRDSLADVPERLWAALGLTEPDALALRGQLKAVLANLEQAEARAR